VELVAIIGIALLALAAGLAIRHRLAERRRKRVKDAGGQDG
jgi:hypothetical protein